ncbi:DUF6531 domain-containing protein, partial [Ralstonia pseudosolanacearum]|uniref:DUF6531 domain-containing protein n=1 Tax=Ralstonia pseudosolanacearum TaxID=1310165 RepID=UPI0026745685
MKKVRQALAILVSAYCMSWGVASCAANGNYWFNRSRPYITGSTADGTCRALIAALNSEPATYWKGRGVLERTEADSRNDIAACWLTYESAMELFGWPARLLSINRDPSRCSRGFTYQPDGSCEQDRLPERSCAVGHPIFPATGTKILTQRDDVGSLELPLTRNYRSYMPVGETSGTGSWLFNWQRRLDVGSAGDTKEAQVIAIRADGAVDFFVKNGNAWNSTSTLDELQSVANAQGAVTGWQHTIRESGAVETYDANGALLSVRESNGQTTTLAYNSKRQLTQVTAPSGRSLTFAYDSQNRVSNVTASRDGVQNSFRRTESSKRSGCVTDDAK